MGKSNEKLNVKLLLNNYYYLEYTNNGINTTIKYLCIKKKINVQYSNQMLTLTETYLFNFPGFSLKLSLKLLTINITYNCCMYIKKPSLKN